MLGAIVTEALSIVAAAVLVVSRPAVLISPSSSPFCWPFGRLDVRHASGYGAEAVMIGAPFITQPTMTLCLHDVVSSPSRILTAYALTTPSLPPRGLTAGALTPPPSPSRILTVVETPPPLPFRRLIADACSRRLV